DIANMSGLVGFDATTNVLAVRPVDTRRLRIVWTDRSGKVLSVASTADTDDFVLSPDERTLAYNGADPDTNSTGMWLRDLGRGSVTRITPPDLSSASPVWSPDGRQLAYSPVRSGTFDLFAKDLSPSGAEVQLLHTDGMKAARSWSPDKRYLL